MQLTILAMLLVAAGCVSSKIEPPLLLKSGNGHPGDFRRVDTVHEGDVAPDFRLKMLNGRRRVRLSQFRGKKPVVLIFGSYT